MKKAIVYSLPAEAGDCTVIEFDNQECIIIDCGYKTTYINELKPLLIKLKDKGCRIALLVVTHIDQDHIEGAIELIKDNGNSDNPNIIEIDNIWYNGFFNTLFLNEIFEQHKCAVVERESQKNKMRLIKAQLEMQIQRATSSDYISAKHSKSFEELCSLNHYKFNEQFKDKVVKRRSDNKEDVINNNIKFGEISITVLAPNQMLLDGLAKEFHKELVRNFGIDYYLSEDGDFSSMFELIMRLHYETESFSGFIATMGNDIEKWIGTSSMSKMNVINNAAIVIEIEYQNLRLLFTADSDSDYWAMYLKEFYDVIKVSHHGTTKPNMQLIDKTKGKYIIISTNGERYGHPEKELIARLILNGNRNLYFNYAVNLQNTLCAIQEKYNFNAYFGINKIIL
jgi:Predicted hydrolase (metallo-beta-lactamase superfamily)